MHVQTVCTRALPAQRTEIDARVQSAVCTSHVYRVEVCSNTKLSFESCVTVRGLSQLRGKREGSSWWGGQTGRDEIGEHT